MKLSRWLLSLPLLEVDSRWLALGLYRTDILVVRCAWKLLNIHTLGDASNEASARTSFEDIIIVRFISGLSNKKAFIKRLSSFFLSSFSRAVCTISLNHLHFCACVALQFRRLPAQTPKLYLSEP